MKHIEHFVNVYQLIDSYIYEAGDDLFERFHKWNEDDFENLLCPGYFQQQMVIDNKTVVVTDGGDVVCEQPVIDFIREAVEYVEMEAE